jgi:hypothetical protein
VLLSRNVLASKVRAMLPPGLPSGVQEDETRSCTSILKRRVAPESPPSQAALETFRSSGPDTEQRRAMLTVSLQEYPIADVRAVFGEGAE